jgi:hypothetical protein
MLDFIMYTCNWHVLVHNHSVAAESQDHIHPPFGVHFSQRWSYGVALCDVITLIKMAIKPHKCLTLTRRRDIARSQKTQRTRRRSHRRHLAHCWDRELIRSVSILQTNKPVHRLFVMKTYIVNTFLYNYINRQTYESSNLMNRLAGARQS